MRHCRDEALQVVSDKSCPQSQDEFIAAVAEAVDIALHNVTDLLEGYWKTMAGPDNGVEYVLSVRVTNNECKPVESIEISPCLIDLPIGYWKWKDNDFR